MSHSLRGGSLFLTPLPSKVPLVHPLSGSPLLLSLPVPHPPGTVDWAGPPQRSFFLSLHLREAPLFTVPSARRSGKASSTAANRPNSDGVLAFIDDEQEGDTADDDGYDLRVSNIRCRPRGNR